jgi:two-component system C4-dicarboxylate transport response regulator DctD
MINRKQHLSCLLDREHNMDLQDAGAVPTTSSRTVLVIEDDEFLRHGLKQLLEGAGYRAHVYELANAALEEIGALQPDLVLTDLYLGDKNDINGLDVVARLHELDPELPVILMTARGNIPVAVEAIRAGAYDFVEKPFDNERMLVLLERACEARRLVLENRRLQGQLTFASGIERILVGESEGMKALRNAILRVAPAPANVIILGETGAGKEMVARCLHEFSGRKGNFVAINCAAIPDNLFESELFGHEAGSFTGASKQRIGKLEYADGGTLFLDEIEAMPMHLQVKILRVIQERQVERLGSNKLMPIDLRVVAASKVDLKEHSAQEKFRLDLYYRLNVASVRIPPLRERREDIPLLFAHFLREAALRFGQQPAVPSKEVQQELLVHDWPGNVRELRNAAEQLQLGIPLTIGDGRPAAENQSLEAILGSVEKAVIDATLRRHDGSANAACADLQINYSTLYRKMKAFGMDLADYRGATSDS